MNVKTFKIGVIYQCPKELQKYQDRLRLHPHGELTVEEDCWTVVGEYPNILDTQVTPFKKEYTFHMIKTFQDVHNVAGFVFSVCRFAGGMYDAETLNYLNSRIRG